MKQTLATLFAVTIASTTLAQEATTYAFDGDFDDATFAVESAIVDKGLVIDYVSHIGEMLARTGEDVGSGELVFTDAQSFLFCSAVTSRNVMEIDPLNIAHCPYSVFVYHINGEVTVGYRNMPDGEMQEVQTLLDDIVQDALGN